MSLKRPSASSRCACAINPCAVPSWLASAAASSASSGVAFQRKYERRVASSYDDRTGGGVLRRQLDPIEKMRRLQHRLDDQAGAGLEITGHVRRRDQRRVRRLLLRRQRAPVGALAQLRDQLRDARAVQLRHRAGQNALGLLQRQRRQLRGRRQVLTGAQIDDRHDGVGPEGTSRLIGRQGQPLQHRRRQLQQIAHAVDVLLLRQALQRHGGHGRPLARGGRAGTAAHAGAAAGPAARRRAAAGSWRPILDGAVAARQASSSGQAGDQTGNQGRMHRIWLCDWLLDVPSRKYPCLLIARRGPSSAPRLSYTWRATDAGFPDDSATDWAPSCHSLKAVVDSFATKGACAVGAARERHRGNLC